MIKKLLVEGWRGINHSYAMVNQYQTLEFAKSNVDLYHNDVPFFRSDWNSQKNFCGFGLDSIKALQSIPSLNAQAIPEITYRISFPYNLTSARSQKLYVFGTSEYQIVTRDMLIVDGAPSHYKDLPLTIITPSNWSKEGFLRSGFSDDQVKVISHGVDLSIFKPLELDLKKRYRELLGADEASFVILSLGAMTTNKGIDVLLSAYIQLKRHYPQLKLVLKDQSNLYGFTANDLVNRYLQLNNINLESSEIRDAIAGISFITENLDLNQLNGLYNAADCYVSPYRAEGFNLPPLEAAAAGLPIVITQGGSTDDYAHPSYALQIESEKKFSDNQCFLEPNLDSLTHQLTALIEKKEKNLNVNIAREFIASNLSWSKVCNDLLKEMA